MRTDDNKPDDAVNKPSQQEWEEYENNLETEKEYLFRGDEEDIHGAKVRWLQRRWEQKKRELDRTPFIKRFLTSEADQFIFLKFILGIPIGVLTGWVLYNSVLSQLEIEPMSVRMQFALGFVAFYALGFAWSTGMRCITFLLIPIVFGNGGRFYLYAVLLTILISGPLGTMICNGHEVFRAFLCGFNLLKNQTKIGLTVTLVPLLDILIALVKNQDEFLTEVSKFGEKIKAFLDSLLFPELDEAKVAKVELPNDNEDSTEEGLDLGLVGQLKEDDNRRKLMQEKMKAFYELLRIKCEAMLDWAENKCHALWWQLIGSCCVVLCLFFWLCFVILCVKRCNIKEMPKEHLGYNCSDIGSEASGDEFADRIINLKKMVDHFFNKFEAKFQYEIPESDEGETTMMVTAEQIEAVINQAFAFKSLVIEFTSKTITRCIPFLFVILIYQSQNYLDKFITDVTFDNKYMTSYFVHIDNRRKLLMKRFLLPLKKMERSEITELFEYKLTQKDVMVIATSSSWMITLAVYFLAAFAIDYCFASLLQLFRLYGAVDFVHKGHHEFAISIQGNGLIANALKFFTKGFNQKRSLYVETTNRSRLTSSMKLH